MTKQYKRRRLLIDRRIQGALVIRVFVYWLCCLLTVSLFTACWIVISSGSMTSGQLIQQMTSRFAPAMGASLLVLPIVVLDSLRQSNRFAGPMYRIRRAMKQVADGEPVEPIMFRDGDYWHDFSVDFNRAVSKLQQK